MSNLTNSLFDLKETATVLGVSSATIRNWTKYEYLTPSADNFFNVREVENLKEQIANGKVGRLNGRANKATTDRNFIPDEYLSDKNNIRTITEIVEFVNQKKIHTDVALFFLALNVLKSHNLVNFSVNSLSSLKSPNKQIERELKNWLANSEIKLETSEYDFLLDLKIPEQCDVLGLLYQSLLAEGKKSKNGSYYTPKEIVSEIVDDYFFSNAKVLDPCCGTGQFLLAFARKMDNPDNIYGFDIDETAVKIARLNLLIFYKDKDFEPNIICKNTLLDVGSRTLFETNDNFIGTFDIVTTNPPWGVHFSEQEKNLLKETSPQIQSGESFAYFLKKSIDLLKPGGTLSFVLPESILNVKTHSDIRKYILDNSSIEKVVFMERVFKNVFTPVIRLDIKKVKTKDNKFFFYRKEDKYEIEQERLANNQDFVFDMHVNQFDSEIFAKVASVKQTSLKNKAEWALGIVTGNNEKYISSEKKDGYEPIFKGKDVDRFTLKQPSNYIKFTPEVFQQVAPQEKYRAQEKLIYKFISKNLVFAYDNKQSLSLNSANIVIPLIPNYPIKVLAALFNSSLYQFIFQKKFSSIKVLKNHIEQLPVPLLSNDVSKELVSLVDKQISGVDCYGEIDAKIMKIFNLSNEQICSIKNFINL